MTTRESASGPGPTISVVVVSDYESGSEIGWAQLRKALEGLALQDIDEPFEVLICENDSLAESMPASFCDIVRESRLLRSPATGSQALKNAAVRESRAEFIAILDGDVVPSHDWLRHLVAVMRARPAVAVVSGRTLHGGETFTERALALIERAYVDRGHAGMTRFIASHAALFRREWWDAHPCAETGGPFSSRLQSEGLLRDGHQIYFEPAARTYHAYAGWTAQVDIFRNAGFGTIITRRIDPRLPHAWAARLGPAAIPLVIAGKTWTSLRNCWRLFPDYGIRALELPALLGLAVVAHLLEAPGMWRAYHHAALADSAYR